MILAHEKLGRAISSETSARRSRPHWRDLLPGKGENDLSMDRLTFAPNGAAQEIAQKRAQASDSKTFQKWIALLAINAKCSGRAVAVEPVPGNAYHMIIVLPTEDREAQKSHAKALASVACWAEATEKPG